MSYRSGVGCHRRKNNVIVTGNKVKAEGRNKFCNAKCGRGWVIIKKQLLRIQTDISRFSAFETGNGKDISRRG
jgi:hypothetical protein